MPDATSLNAAFMVVQSNSLNELRSLVISVMRRYPLAPLEKWKSPWCKAMASRSGSSWHWLKTRKRMTWAAAVLPPQSTVQLPGSFMWQRFIAWSLAGMKSYGQIVTR